MNVRKQSIRRRSPAGIAVLVCVGALALTGYGAPKETGISPEKARLMGCVEHYLSTGDAAGDFRKSLAWGDIKTGKDGGSTIRYEWEALKEDGSRVADAGDFTFDKKGRFLSVEKTEGYPKTTTSPVNDPFEQNARKTAERYVSEKFPDLTGNKSFRWGRIDRKDDGGFTIDYRFGITEWDKNTWSRKETQIFRRLKFDKEGKCIGDEDSELSPEEKVADRFLGHLLAGEYDKARDMGIDLLKDSITAEQLKKTWDGTASLCGKFVESSTDRTTEEQGFPCIYKKCVFAEAEATLKIVVDKEKVAGFFITDIQKKKAEEKPEAAKTKRDVKGSQRAAAAGWRLFMQGKPDEAEPKFKEAAELNPENANAFQGLGWARLNRGLTDEAKETFATCLKLDPKNAAALNGLGVIARGEGDEKAMLDAWLKAVDVDKAATGPIAGLADFYEKKGDRKNAAKYYKMWTEADPNDANAKAGLERTEN